MRDNGFTKLEMVNPSKNVWSEGSKAHLEEK